MNSPIGSCWDDVRLELFTPEEISESDLRVSLISEIIKESQSKELNQK